MNKEWPLEAERELLADSCVLGRHPHALWNFVRFAAGWHARCTSDPLAKNWVTARVHRPLLDWVQEKILAWREARRLGISKRTQIVICVPRGFGKSYLLTCTVPIFCQLEEPNGSWYIGSETVPKAEDFMQSIKGMLDGTDPYALFTWFYGCWYIPGRKWNQGEIITGYRTATGLKEPSVGTFAVETGITSKHPQGVMYDDPVSDEKMKDGGTWLKAANDSLDSIYPALGPESIMFLIGTRYHDEDPIGKSLSSGGVDEWVGFPPIEKFDDGVWHVYFLQARDTENTSTYPKGEPVLPESGWTNEELEWYERRSPQKYAAQMMNNPSQGEHAELTREQQAKMRIPRSELPSNIEYATVHLDTAFKDTKRREKGDRTAIVTWLHDARATGIVYFDGARYSRSWRSEDLDTQLIAVLLDLRRRGIRVRAITDEIEVGGKRGVYRAHLEQVVAAAGIRVPEILQFNRAGVNKAVRIREAASYWLDNCVRLIDDAPGLDVLCEEMRAIGFSRFDDVSDAAADVFRTEIYRGRPRGGDDEQPLLPIQPGDDVLKGRIQRDLEQMEREMHMSPFAPNPDDVQPYEALFLNGTDGQF